MEVFAVVLAALMVGIECSRWLEVQKIDRLFLSLIPREILLARSTSCHSLQLSPLSHSSNPHSYRPEDAMSVAPPTPRSKQHAHPKPHQPPIRLHHKPSRFSIKKLLFTSVALGIFSFVWAGLESIKVRVTNPNVYSFFKSH